MGDAGGEGEVVHHDIVLGTVGGNTTHEVGAGVGVLGPVDVVFLA